MDFQADAIDRVINNAVNVLENSKLQILEILDSARNELKTLSSELQNVMKETAETVEKVDQLEVNYRKSRIRLTEVSRDFVRYNEEDIKQAYEKATQLQLDLLIYREKEMYLKARRDELQKRARNVEKSVERGRNDQLADERRVGVFFRRIRTSDPDSRIREEPSVDWIEDYFGPGRGAEAHFPGDSRRSCPAAGESSAKDGNCRKNAC
ncbi:hypothetical protein HMSSN139_54520 [Paenibacillus sp. HMSSN-139]|nr:hypothetical protein HMSSN139_54520 [Paenibacillus sp. HMSSN-139]